MTCSSVIEKKHVTLSPEKTVEDALNTLRKKKVSAAAVIGDNESFLGIFSIGVLLKNLIPVPITTSNGVQIDIKMTATPGVEKRLAGLLPLKVSEVIERNPVKAHPDEPIWEVVGRMAKYGEPISVIDENNKFMGIVTYDSLVEELRNSLKG